jgi:ElaB/YqjD/DUF883 family membrane-anchored ribosome-binding protein
MINRLPKEFSAPSSTSAARGSRISPLASDEPQTASSRVMEAVANCMGSRPLVSLGVMFAVGIVLGKLVKR